MQDNNDPEILTKLEAAKRQLDTAIYLYFNNLDSVSTYALTAAAIDVLKDIAKSKNIQTALEEFKNVIKPEYHDYFLDLINKPKLFFKHADQDPEGKLKFYPRSSEALMFIAIIAYVQISGNSTQDMEVYCIWDITRNPDLIKSPDPENDPFKEILKKANKIQKGLNKESYYNGFISDPNVKKLNILKTIANKNMSDQKII